MTAKTSISPTGHRLVQIDGSRPVMYLFRGNQKVITARWVKTKLNWKSPAQFQWLLQAHNFSFYPPQDDEFHRRIRYQIGYEHGTNPNQWMILSSNLEAVELMMRHGFIEDMTPPETITAPEAMTA